MPAARGHELLHQGSSVHAQPNFPCLHRPLQIGCRVVTHNARPAAPNVGLDDNRKAQPLRRFRHALRLVDHAGARVWQAQVLQVGQLQCFRRFHRKGLPSVDHAHAQTFLMRQQAQCVENGGRLRAQVGAGGHPVEKDAVLSLRLRGVIHVSARVQSDIRRAAPV